MVAKWQRVPAPQLNSTFHAGLMSPARVSCRRRRRASCRAVYVKLPRRARTKHAAAAASSDRHVNRGALPTRNSTLSSLPSPLPLSFLGARRSSNATTPSAATVSHFSPFAIEATGGTGPLPRSCTCSSPSNCATRVCRRTCSWASSRRTSRLRFAGARLLTLREGWSKLDTHSKKEQVRASERHCRWERKKRRLSSDPSPPR